MPYMERDPAAPKPAPPAPLTSDASWMHALRNELNTATMCLAVLHQLAGTQLSDEARLYLERAEAACLRCGGLLQPARGN